jgi:spermidine synthase
MRIARPWSLELDYTRDLMMPLVLRDAPRRVLQVGLGAASITRFLYRHFPDARLTVVEILPEVVAVARQYFKLPEDDRIRIVLGDGHDFMASGDERYDMIVVDAFDARGRSGMLDTAPFYLNCRARLRPEGLFAANLLTRSRGAAPTVARLGEAFDGHVLVLPPSEAGNAVALARGSKPLQETFGDLRASARRLRNATGLDLLPALARLEARDGGDGVTL